MDFRPVSASITTYPSQKISPQKVSPYGDPHCERRLTIFAVLDPWCSTAVLLTGSFSTSSPPTIRDISPFTSSETSASISIPVRNRKLENIPWKAGRGESSIQTTRKFIPSPSYEIKWRESFLFPIKFIFEKSWKLCEVVRCGLMFIVGDIV